MHVQQYCETLFNLSYSGPLQMYHRSTDTVSCAVCATSTLVACVFEVCSNDISLRVHGGEVCESCASLITNTITSRHAMRIESVNQFMKQRKTSIDQSLDRVTRCRPSYYVFEHSAKAEVKKWIKYYSAVRFALRPHFRSLPFYLTFKVMCAQRGVRVCRVCGHRSCDRSIVMIFGDYLSRTLLYLCNHCRQLLFLPRIFKHS